MSSPLFNSGMKVMTKGIKSLISSSPEMHDFVINCMNRHLSGEWGNLETDDIEMNNQSVEDEKNGKFPDMILSCYESEDGTEIWIITDSDRKATTVLLPEEY